MVVEDEAFEVLIVDIFGSEEILERSLRPAFYGHNHIPLPAESLQVGGAFQTDFVEVEALEEEGRLDLIILFMEGKVVLLVVGLEEVYVDVSRIE